MWVPVITADIWCASRGLICYCFIHIIYIYTIMYNIIMAYYYEYFLSHFLGILFLFDNVSNWELARMKFSPR